MKSVDQFVLLTVMLTLLLSGCSFTRDPLRSREDFFHPVAALPQRSHSPVSSIEFEQLKNRLESATNAAIIARDSLASLRRFTDSVLASKDSRSDNVRERESKNYLPAAVQPDSGHGIVELHSENKEMSQQLKEIRTQVFASTMSTASSIFASAGTSSHGKNDYAKGLSFFQQRRYSEALSTFRNLIQEGIEENIADHCEYWIGECHFAKQEYADAIIQFQKVLTMKSSNKKTDAYFMLGKTYEQTGDLEIARTMYNELMVSSPNNRHAQTVKSRLVALNNTLRVQRTGR